MRATRAIIHIDSLKRNIQLIRKRVGEGRLICAPIKADAYGHGAAPVAKACLEAGVQRLAVATVDEGAELRAAGINAPILLLSFPMPDEYESVVSLGLTPFVGDKALAAGLERAAASLNARDGAAVHLKVDTGMGRIGCAPEEAAELARFIASLSHVRLEGVATHLAVSDSLKPEDIRYTQEQIRRFVRVIEAIRKAGVDPGVVHAAASGGVLLHEEAWFDMARPGIVLYGYTPDPALAGLAPFEPVMELVSHIVYIKQVKKGESVSYGRTWTAPCDTTIATIPVGYGDGLNRLLSNNYSVLIKNKRYPIVGRICMDQCLVDLGKDGAACKKFEKVTIFGAKPACTAADMAEILHTIPYEITCNINKRVPRVFEEAVCEGCGRARRT
ncbi:MAG: alanine racemase [Treponema sp.]|jgi:alanine racemase|nr:alanine racemase [Treponema sp.]